MMNTYRKTHYTLRHRMIATLSQRLDGITYTQRHGLIRGMKRQGGLGFLPALLAGGSTETAEHRFLRQLDLQGKVSYERVLQNLGLNARDNVRVRHLAVGDLAGSLTLLSDPLMPGGTSGDPTVA